MTVNVPEGVGSHALGSAPADDEGQAPGVSRFLGCLDQLTRNYAFCLSVQWSSLGFNDSLAAAKRSLNPKSRKRLPRRRIDPQLEAYIGVKAIAAAQQKNARYARPSQADVNSAAAEALASLKAIRGRPADTILAFHVHAFMALYRQTCGKELRGSLTRGSVYDPHLHGPMGDLFLKMLREHNPAVTMTQMVTIVTDAHKDGTTLGRSFESYFPFQSDAHPASGMPEARPGHRLERFDWLPPIYSS